MKKTLKVLALIAVFVLAGLLAQAQPHPGQQNGGGAVSGGPIGGSAPIGDGSSILLLSALAFGAIKFYRTRQGVLRAE